MIRTEAVRWLGEERFRFWISPSPLGRGIAISDGGTYQTSAGAREAGEILESALGGGGNA